MSVTPPQAKNCVRVHSDEKAVSPLLGFILVLLILAIFMSVVQSQYVPAWCKEAEAKHFEVLKAEFSTIPSIVASQRDGYVTLTAGLKYPGRPLFITPPPTKTISRLRARRRIC